LKVLPPSARIVAFLGLDAPYLDALFERIQQLHPDVRPINDLAYATDRVTFVHLIHPSPLAIKHRQAWLRDDEGSLADKRREVLSALGKTEGDSVSIPIKKKSRSAYSTPRAIARPFEPSAKHEDLIAMVRDAMKGGKLDAREVGNARTKSDEINKLLRLRRADGEEFAIQRTGNDFRVWSSVPPTTRTPLAEPKHDYPPTKTRHSNLGVMPKLRGPNDRGRVGAMAWQLRFHTPAAVLDFITGA
jgi:hypothetical protein